jgi:hypothetical protein
VKIYSFVFSILACAWQLQKKVLWPIICRLSSNNRPITDYLKTGRLIGFADYLPINRLIPSILRANLQSLPETMGQLAAVSYNLKGIAPPVPPVQCWANKNLMFQRFRARIVSEHRVI